LSSGDGSSSSVSDGSGSSDGSWSSVRSSSASDSSPLPHLFSSALAMPPGHTSVLLSSPAVWGQAAVSSLDVSSRPGDSLVWGGSSNVLSESGVLSLSGSLTDLVSEDQPSLLSDSDSSGSLVVNEK